MFAKIYRITLKKGYVQSEEGTHYSLTPWGGDTAYYEGHDDGGKVYRLPDGYTVGQSVSGTQEIYGPDGYPVFCIEKLIKKQAQAYKEAWEAEYSQPLADAMTEAAHAADKAQAYKEAWYAV
jgi:hypothetical protein